MDASASAVRESSTLIKKFPGYVDNFKSYKVGRSDLKESLFGKMQLKQSDWIDSSKRML